MPRASGAVVTDWAARFDELAAREPSLSASELDTWGLAAWFLGREAECEHAWDAAQRSYLASGETDAAVQCVFWIGFTLSEHGEVVRAGAWMARLFELCHADSAGPRSEAIAVLCESVGAYAGGRLEQSAALAERAVELATTAGDADTAVLARMGLGRALMHLGEVQRGTLQMDRVMVAISSGAVSDRVAGPAYCAVIASCLARWDVERARLWTRDLTSWCDAQRGLEPFRGECSVHRATVLRLGGEWSEAESALSGVAVSEQRIETLENALYGLADLHRLAGRRAEAEELYQRVAGLGREVQPGLALLRRDAGSLDAAQIGIVRALASAPDPGPRADLLAAQVDIDVDRGAVESAEHAAVELRMLAEAIDTTYLHALSDRASAVVLIAGTEPERALPLLRNSWRGWRRLDAQYEAAITRTLLGRACRQLGDEDAAQLEFDAARVVLSALGAIPDLDRLERNAAEPDRTPAVGGLTPREIDVLRLVARGLSNRQIATELFLSERTVARHVSNMLGKLDLANRAAATAFAFENGVVATH